MTDGEIWKSEMMAALPFLARTAPEFESEAAVCGDVGITELAPNTVPRRRRRRKRKSRDDKLKPEKETAVGAGSSKGDGAVQPAAGKGKKLARLRLSRELMEYIRTREVVGIMATETPRPSLVRIPQEDMFDSELREQIAAEYEEHREFDAYVLYQYRTKGYAEIQYVVTNDEEV